MLCCSRRLPLVHYLGPLDGMVWVALGPALAVMAAILLTQAFEFAELFWAGSLRHQAHTGPVAPGTPLPRVSIHLACSNEPPDMVIATIESLLALDWPDFEVLVVDNNTQDPALWRPVQAHVQARMQALSRATAGTDTAAPHASSRRLHRRVCASSTCPPGRASRPAP